MSMKCLSPWPWHDFVLPWHDWKRYQALVVIVWKMLIVWKSSAKVLVFQSEPLNRETERLLPLTSAVSRQTY